MSMLRVTGQIQRLPYIGDGTDSFGNEHATWGAPEPVDIYAVDPGRSIEPHRDGHDRIISTPTIYLPYGSPFQPHDRCLLDGDIYEVEGHPARWKHPHTGQQIGDVIHLKKVEG